MVIILRSALRFLGLVGIIVLLVPLFVISGLIILPQFMILGLGLIFFGPGLVFLEP
jgi:hypothetical protein